jgi:hypothetical protein
MSKTAQYSGWHKGWLAFVNGQAVRRQNKAIRVFKTEAEALAAANKSMIGRTYKGLRIA